MRSTELSAVTEPRTRANRLARPGFVPDHHVGENDLPETCPRCGWPCDMLIVPFYESPWAAHGGICGQCCVEAANHFDKTGWPGAPLSDPGQNAPAPVRSDAHDTEKAAAWSVYPKTGTVREAVLKQIAAAGDQGCTQQEMEEALAGQAAPSSVRTRCSELVAGGWVCDSGRTRPTAAGLDSIVWTLTPEGKSRFPT